MSIDRGGIITNLDKKLSDAEIEKVERGERRQAFIDGQIKQAEKDEREGTERPDLIYSGLQRQDVFTADPLLDKDTDRLRRLRSEGKPLPIKEMSVSPTGDFEITVVDEVVKALAQGYWCATCHEPQPENEISWLAQANRLELVLGPKPGWAAHGTMCCYCGARLGLGSHDAAQSALYNMTPEQRKLLEEMFGPVRAPE